MFFALDGTGSRIAFSTTEDSQGSQVGSSCITDPVTGTKQQVAIQYSMDGNTFTGGASLVSSMPMNWNGATFDRQRGNEDVASSIVTVSGQVAGTVNGVTLTNWNQRGAQFGVNISQISGSTTLQITVQGFDVASGTWYNLLVSTAFSATGFNLLTIYPGATVTANVSISTPLPRTFRVIATVAGAGTANATVGVSKIV